MQCVGGACKGLSENCSQTETRQSQTQQDRVSLSLTPLVSSLYHRSHSVPSTSLPPFPLSFMSLIHTCTYICNMEETPTQTCGVYFIGNCESSSVAASHNSDEHPKEYTSTSCSSLLPSPSQAVSTLISRLPSRQASLSASAFERVLTACADSLQLRTAYLTFSCMTHTHRVAPSRLGLQALGRLLCAPSLTADPHWRRFRLAFTSRILDGQYHHLSCDWSSMYVYCNSYDVGCF